MTHAVGREVETVERDEGRRGRGAGHEGLGGRLPGAFGRRHRGRSVETPDDLGRFALGSLPENRFLVRQAAKVAAEGAGLDEPGLDREGSGGRGRFALQTWPRAPCSPGEIMSAGIRAW